MDPTALSKALTGQRNFTSLEIALIAEHLGIPTDALLADDDANVGPVAVAARVQEALSVRRRHGADGLGYPL